MNTFYQSGESGHVPFLLVPEPISLLMRAGVWTQALVLVRWHRHLQVQRRLGLLRPNWQWPPADHVVWSREGQNEEDQAGDLHTDACRSIAQDIKV